MPKQKNAIRRPDYVMALLGKAMTFMHQKEVPISGAGITAMGLPATPNNGHRRADQDTKEGNSRIDRVREACGQELSAFYQASPSITVLSLSALDGFDIISLARNPDFKPARFSVISNALATISRAVTTEFELGQSDFTLINSSQGRIVTMHLAGMGMGLVLAVIVSEEAILGSLLINLKNICEKISLRLDGSK